MGDKNLTIGEMVTLYKPDAQGDIEIETVTGECLGYVSTKTLRDWLDLVSPEPSARELLEWAFKSGYNFETLADILMHNTGVEDALNQINKAVKDGD